MIALDYHTIVVVLCVAHLTVLHAPSAVVSMIRPEATCLTREKRLKTECGAAFDIDSQQRQENWCCSSSACYIVLPVTGFVLRIVVCDKAEKCGFPALATGSIGHRLSNERVATDIPFTLYPLLLRSCSRILITR